MIVRRVCSWCRTCYALVIWPEAARRLPDTHGVCTACAADWRVGLSLAFASIKGG